MSAWREEPPGSGRWRKNLYVNGVSHKLTFRGPKKDAEMFEAQKRLELGASGPIAPGSVLVYEKYCAEKYKPAAKASLRKTTWNVRRYQLERLIIHFGKLKLTKILEPAIEAYKITRRSEGADPVTINTELNVLSATLTYARDTLRIACAHPKIKRFVVRRKKGKVAFYTRSEVGYIFAACAEVAPLFLVVFTFLFETGARKSEAIHLAWKNVLFEQRMVRIWSEVDDDDHDSGGDDGDPYQVKSLEREMPLSDHLLRMLAELKLKGLSREWVFPVVTARMKTKGERYIEFPSNTWDRVLKRATELALADDPKARPIKGGPHRARHTFASHFLAAKPDLFLLGRLLGHSTSRVTEIYAHLVPEHLAEARNVVTFDPAKAAKSEKPSLDRPQEAKGS